MKKANRLSKQNYCNVCQFRSKLDGKTICTKYILGVELAMTDCELLTPFDKHKEIKEQKKMA